MIIIYMYLPIVYHFIMFLKMFLITLFSFGKICLDPACKAGSKHNLLSDIWQKLCLLLLYSLIYIHTHDLIVTGIWSFIPICIFTRVGETSTANSLILFSLQVPIPRRRNNSLSLYTHHILRNSIDRLLRSTH